jgi:polar amino acid transport system substrate-binding protein
MRCFLDAPRRGTQLLLALILALSCVHPAPTISAQAAPLTLVSTAWPPFTNAAGQPRFALDLVEAALGRVGLTARTTIVTNAEFTPALLSGRFDGSAAVWKDPEREEVLIFSQPYLENRLVLVGRHGADVSAKTLGDLKGKRISIVEGYSYGESIDRAGPVFVRSNSEEDSLSQLLNGDVDYALVDELVVHYIVRNYPKESAARLQIGSTPLVRRELFFAVSKARPDAESIVARFNAQLRGMIADRTYHRLLHVDWIRADVNDDGVPEFVPASDRPGRSAPKQAYTLFTTEIPVSRSIGNTGFFIGGNIYSDWASVPESYKEDSTPPDPRRSTATIFTFRW